MAITINGGSNVDAAVEVESLVAPDSSVEGAAYPLQITRRCKGTQGMRDFVALSPSTNPIIAEDELPRTSASLITVA